MRNAAVNGSPGGASRSPSCEISALAGAVIGSKQISVLARGGERLRVRVALEELDAERAAGRRDRERARALGQLVAVVERAVLERAVAERGRLALAGRDQVVVEQQVPLDRQVDLPLRPRRAGHAQVRVVAEG